MKITDVVLNFRTALESLALHSQFVRIPWRTGDAYDEWDEMASAMFRGLVVAVLEWGISSAGRVDLRLPEYDVIVSRYESTLEVANPSLGVGRYVFHSFGSSEAGFDRVFALQISDQNEVLVSDPIACPIENSEFMLRWKVNGNWRVVRDVQLQ
ncbi:MAG: hypothetical protein HC882_01135 [Acidobacteria bacterium]|nr:hypothetical protein [Acidobacteriota bacterium]